MTRREEAPIDAWQADTVEASRMPVEELRARAERLARTTRVRNYGGYATIAVVLAGAVWWLIQVADPLATVGALLTMAGVLAIAAQLRDHRLGGSGVRPLPGGCGASQRQGRAGLSAADRRARQLSEESFMTSASFLITGALLL